MILSYKYRLLPTRKQHAALARILEDRRLLYNAALEERVTAYKKAGKRISFAAQCRSLTECRRELPHMEAASRGTQEATLKRLDLAFEAFFRRIKAGQKPGHPRFRGKERWRSFTIRDSRALSIAKKRVRFKGLPGSVRFHEHRPLPRAMKITSAVLRKDPKGWTIAFMIDISATCPQECASAIGIDVGLKSLATLSTGQIIPNARHAERAERKMRRRQRALARCKRGSKRCVKVKAEFARTHQRIVNARTTYLHQVSAALTRDHQTIVVEKLNVSGLAQTNIARSLHDAAWSSLKYMLAYKAERAGGRLIEVSPQFTSQDCSGCGERVPKALSVREHSCPSCGLVLDRDHNAALNILHKAKLGLEAGNVAQWSARRPRNIGGIPPETISAEG